MPESVTVSSGTGRHTVTITAVFTGKGVIVHLFGGEKPHVGAVAISLPRPSLKDPRVTSSDAIVVPLPGHKDDELARPVGKHLASFCNEPVVVVAGLHVDQATASDIDLLQENTRAALDKLCARIQDIIKIDG
jgi:hypothetical protein